jgi:hypothetical protein
MNTTEDSFSIGACGRFNADIKILSKTEATQLYIELHKWLFLEKNIYLSSLKELYKFAVRDEESEFYIGRLENYQSVRAFCLDTGIVSYDDAELMEYEVNQSFLGGNKTKK